MPHNVQSTHVCCKTLAIEPPGHVKAIIRVLKKNMQPFWKLQSLQSCIESWSKKCICINCTPNRTKTRNKKLYLHTIYFLISRHTLSNKWARSTDNIASYSLASVTNDEREPPAIDDFSESCKYKKSPNLHHIIQRKWSYYRLCDFSVSSKFCIFAVWQVLVTQHIHDVWCAKDSHLADWNAPPSRKQNHNNSLKSSIGGATGNILPRTKSLLPGLKQIRCHCELEESQILACILNKLNKENWTETKLSPWRSKGGSARVQGDYVKQDW